MMFTLITLFVILLALAAIRVNAEEAIVYEPAAGYYYCPSADLICSIQECHLPGGCGQFLDNFVHVPDVVKPNETVYISTGPHASITLGLGDATRVICDAECTCQPLVSFGDGSCEIAMASQEPSSSPSLSQSPSMVPSDFPSDAPSVIPSSTPSHNPSSIPSVEPTVNPTQVPTVPPTSSASSTPSNTPTMSPAPLSVVPPTSTTSNNPTPLPTMESPIHQILFELSGNVVYDPLSPQGKAVQWLLETDELPYDPILDTTKLSQRYALVSMDFEFHSGVSSWSNATTDECDWFGVTCAHFDGVPYVRNINWARQNLQGVLLPEFSLLPALETLDLAQNKIRGTLDPLYELTFLKNLYLFENDLSGTIGIGLRQLPRLERLYLGHNQLTGTLSPGLWQDHRDRPLQWLILHHNNFNGTLPLGMRLGHLRYFDASNNHLSGTIPSDWPEKLISMRSLILSHNSLIGSIPSNFPKIGTGWLKQLMINDNMLTGRFPEGWDPIWYLTNIDIRNNQFTRDIPSSVCSMNVFEEAEMVELRADCDVCDCRRLCDNCRSEATEVERRRRRRWRDDDDDDH